jgi:predicted MFS family arabinose efflux permease
LGVLFSAVGVGGAVGSILAPKLKARFGFGWLLLSVIWIHSALWLLLAVSSSLPIIGLILVLFTMSMPIFGVASLSYRLTVTPQHLLSRVGTVFSLILLSAAPVGASGAGLLLDRLGTKWTALLFAGWVLILAIFASRRSGLRNLEPAAAKLTT